MSLKKRLVRREVVGTVVGVSPLLSRVLSARGIQDAADINPGLGALPSPEGFKGLDAAARLVADALESGRRILIVGDFDADGATSCALLVSGFRAMGAGHVRFLVPNRFEFGYGLTPEIVDVAARQSPDLLITVDNGISSLEGVEHARSLGIDVVITDHHLPGDRLPGANAIVNPRQPGCAFPAKHLAGVGVAFYLLSAVRADLRRRGWFSSREEPNLASYLPLVALGTVADVVPLDACNRILVSEGLRRLRAGQGSPGLLALLRQASIEPREMTSRDLAFGIAPRLNAAGRLDNMTIGIDCLLAPDDETAISLAIELDTLNRERRRIEDEMKAQVLDLDDDSGWISPKDAVGVVVCHESWHQGVIGIVAARVKERVHRPVIAFAPGSEGQLKGSARSIPGLHIRDALDAIATKHPGLLVKFGGHAMAAGLTLAAGDIDRFAAAFDAEARDWLDDEDLEQVVLSDGEIDEEITKDLAQSVIEAAPWGQQFDEPVFDGRFEVQDQRIVGGRHLKLTLRPEQGARSIDAICFNHGTWLLEPRFQHLAYRLDLNRYRGLVSPQLIIEAIL